MSKFWKSTYTVTVLTKGDDPPNYHDVYRLGVAVCKEGTATGGDMRAAHEPITKEEARRIAEERGRDVEYLLGEGA